MMKSASFTLCILACFVHWAEADPFSVAESLFKSSLYLLDKYYFFKGTSQKPSSDPDIVTKWFKEFIVEQKKINEQMKSLYDMIVNINPADPPPTQKLMEINGFWIELLGSIEKNGTNAQHLTERFCGKVFEQHNSLMDNLDQFKIWYDSPNTFFNSYISQKSKTCDVRQSPLWHLQEYQQKLLKLQEDSYHLHLYAFREMKHDMALFETQSRNVLITWRDRKTLQNDYNKSLFKKTPALFCPQAKSSEGPIITRRFCLSTSLCRAHFFSLSGVEINARGTHGNLRMTCHEYAGHVAALQTNGLSYPDGCKKFTKGCPVRGISENPLKVPDLDVQFICRLEFYEERKQLTDCPLLRIKADICNKRNQSHLEIIGTIESDSDSIQTISWPYNIYQNVAMPTETGYIVGVQLASIDNKLAVRFLTSYRETTNSVMKPLKAILNLE